MGKTKAPKAKEKAGRMLGNESFQLALPGLVTAISYDLPARTDYLSARQILLKTAQISDSSRWWLGDLLVGGDKVFHEQWAQAASDTRLSEKVLKSYDYVSRRVPKENRIGPTWTHHREVSKLTHEQQHEWMKRAFDEDWSVEELIAALQEAGLRKKGSDTSVNVTHLCAVCQTAEGSDHICLPCESLVLDAKERKLSKPQKSLIAFAFDYIVEPDEHADAAAKKAWQRQFDKLKKVAASMEIEDADIAA